MIAGVRYVEVGLHPDLVAFVREQVSSGRQRSPAEVVTEALFLLWERDDQVADRTQDRRSAA